MRNDHGKSDRTVVPLKRPNNAPERAAEVVEGRERTKGNTPERNVLRTQGREGTLSGYGKSRNETGNSGSPRSFTMCTTSSSCARPTSR